MRRALWVMGVAGIWLTACSVRTDEAVSLAEAKRLVAQFGRQGFVAPPRTIADVALVVERVPPDPAVVSANLAIADFPPPSDMPAHELAEFYFRRTAAAAQSGRTRQRLADARAALEHGLAANVPFNRLNAFRHALVAAESAAGHPLSAFRERLAQLHADAQESPGWSLATLTLLASQSSELGRLDDATQYLARAQHVLARTRRLPQPEGEDTRLIAAAEGRIALSAGRFSDAERAYRHAIAAMKRFIAVYDQLDATRLGMPPKCLL